MKEITPTELAKQLVAGVLTPKQASIWACTSVDNFTKVPLYRRKSREICIAYQEKQMSIREIARSFRVGADSVRLLLKENQITIRTNNIGLSDEQLRQEYEVGSRSKRQIASKYKTTSAHISRRLRRLGIPNREEVNEALELDDGLIVKLYSDGETLTQIALMLGVSRSTITRRLKKLGTTIDSKKGRSKKPLGDESIVDSYRNGSSLSGLSEKHNVSRNTIRRRLESNGVPIKPNQAGRKKKHVGMDLNVIQSGRKAGKTWDEIAKVTGIPRTTLIRRFKSESKSPPHPIPPFVASENLDMASIKVQHDAGKTLTQLAKENGVSRSTITRKLEVLEGKQTTKTTKKVSMVYLDMDAIKAKYEAGATLTQLAKECGVGRSTITRKLAAFVPAEVKKTDGKPKAAKTVSDESTILDMAAIKAQHEAGVSLTQLAKENGMGTFNYYSKASGF